MRAARSVGFFLGRLLSLALMLVLYGAPAWYLVSSTLRQHLAFVLPILGVGFVASVILWFAFPRAPGTFLWSCLLSVSAPAVGIGALFLAHGTGRLSRRYTLDSPSR